MQTVIMVIFTLMSWVSGQRPCFNGINTIDQPFKLWHNYDGHQIGFMTSKP